MQHYEPTESDAQALNTGRLLRAEGDIILPMIEQKVALILQRIIMHYRAGETERIQQAAAELNVLDDMKQTIKAKILKAEAIERKMYANGNSRSE